MFNFTINKIIIIKPPPIYESYQVYNLTSEIPAGDNNKTFSILSGYFNE